METGQIVTAALSSIALALSLITFVLNYRNARKSAILARKPVLIFEYENGTGWTLRNIGSGPALNVVVAQKLNGEWFNPVRVPPLSKDGKFVLKWLGHVNTTGLGVTYMDTEELPYTSTCGNDLTHVLAGLHLGTWSESAIGKHWNHPQYSEL